MTPLVQAQIRPNLHVSDSKIKSEMVPFPQGYVSSSGFCCLWHLNKGYLQNPTGKCTAFFPFQRNTSPVIAHNHMLIIYWLSSKTEKLKFCSIITIICSLYQNTEVEKLLPLFSSKNRLSRTASSSTRIKPSGRYFHVPALLHSSEPLNSTNNNLSHSKCTKQT